MKQMPGINTIINGCKKGDVKSQTSLFDVHKKKWMGICLRYIKDKEEAQDVFQDAAVKIFQDIRSLKDENAFDGWARRIFVNHALNFIRKKKVYVLTLQAYGDEVVDGNNTDLDVVRRMDSEEVFNLINQLPDGYRVVLNLALIDGYKHAEIAKLLGVSESTSRSQLNKARKSLQRLIENLKLKEHARIAG